MAMVLRKPREYDDERRMENHAEIISKLRGELRNYVGNLGDIQYATGMSREFISLFNRGKNNNPTLDKLIKLSEYLGFKLVLVRREDVEPIPDIVRREVMESLEK